jgi:hypothetical protein
MSLTSRHKLTNLSEFLCNHHVIRHSLLINHLFLKNIMKTQSDKKR